MSASEVGPVESEVQSVESQSAEESASYTTREAGARFSEVLRRVREGTTVTVTRRGDPVAEIRPIGPEPETIEERLADLERRGLISPAEDPDAPLTPGPHVPGAMERFLAERNRY